MTETGPGGIELRRRDRGKPDAWIRAYLRRAPWGAFAVESGAGTSPYLNTNLFYYCSDPDRIYLHTARTGGLPDALEAPKAATFSASGMGRLLPAPEALEFSIEYNGVSATGMLRRIDDREEAEWALQELLDKYAPHLTAGEDYRPPTSDEMKRTAVFRLDVEAWAGKEKVVGEHEGAFELEVVPVPADPEDRPKE